jgi:two-component system sensor histidine kinase MtrB
MVTSFRARLIVTVITLVALTAAFTGVFAYFLVRDSLRSQLVDTAVARVEFNIGLVASEDQLPAGAGRDEFEASGVADRLLLGGAEGVYIEFEDGEAFASSLSLLGTRRLLSADLREIVGRGEFGYQFVAVDRAPVLVVGARRPPTGPDFYFFFPADDVDDTLSQVQRVLLIAAAAALLLGTVAAGLIARRVLRPVAEAGRAADRMADGDLSVRLPVESSDEIGRWAEAFNRMATALQQQIDALVATQERERRFVADVSHELRTPITALVNEAAILERHLDELPESWRNVGNLLVSDADRVRRLIEDLLEISRLDAGTTVEATPVDIEAFLSAVIAERHPQARLRAIGFDRPVGVDRHSLERIVGNLVENARSHAPGAPTFVDAIAEAGTLHIEVRDEGPGVADGELERLFDRFYKSEGARQGGSGLGLAIARQHARRTGGELTVRRGEPGGLVFEALLPVTDLLRGGDGDATSRSDAGNGG